jgi:hypothetical protein
MINPPYYCQEQSKDGMHGRLAGLETGECLSNDSAGVRVGARPVTAADSHDPLPRAVVAALRLLQITPQLVYERFSVVQTGFDGRGDVDQAGHRNGRIGELCYIRH